MPKKITALFLSFILILMLSSCTSASYINLKNEKSINDYTPSKLNLDSYYNTGNNSVYYEIFVGGFSDSDGDEYGDIQGITNRLDYLNDGDSNSGKSLGIDGIWLMPIMKSPSYHKYDVTDYYTIDPNYGDMDDLKTLVSECDKRGVDVIIDLVLNHTSTKNAWFKSMKEAISKGDFTNKYASYYSIAKSNDRESGKVYAKLTGDYYYECNFSTEMPELNLDNPDVLEEIENIVKYYLEEIGIHGFRLDAVKYYFLNDDTKNIAFLKWLKATCDKYEDDCYLVGEDWSSDVSIAKYYEAISCFDFSMSESLGMVSQTVKGENSVTEYTTYLNKYRTQVEAYNENAVLTPFLSNHDQDRSAGWLSYQNGELMMAANLYILTYGTPFIYYGEEIGMKGSRGSAQTDANRRLAMLWGDKDKVKDPIGSTYPSSNQTNGTVKSQYTDLDSIYTYYKKIIQIRHSLEEISLGTYNTLSFDDNNFGGFISTYNGKSVAVFHNTSYSRTIKVFIGEYNSLYASIGLNGATYKDGYLEIGPMTSAILKK